MNANYRKISPYIHIISISNRKCQSLWDFPHLLATSDYVISFNTFTLQRLRTWLSLEGGTNSCHLVWDSFSHVYPFFHYLCFLFIPYFLFHPSCSIIICFVFYILPYFAFFFVHPISTPFSPTVFPSPNALLGKFRDKNLIKRQTSPPPPEGARKRTLPAWGRSSLPGVWDRAGVDAIVDCSGRQLES